MHAPAIEIPSDIRMMRRMTVWMWMLLGALLVATALTLLSRGSWFNLQSIEVEGDTAHHNALTLRANVAPKLQGNFFSVNLATAKGVFEAQPWVRQAVVRRQFPNQLRVQLQEHVPVGLWGRGGASGESQLLNTEGEVFEVNLGEVDTESLPSFQGPQGQSAQVLGMYRQLRKLFLPLELDIDELVLSGRGSWRATLDSGTVIELGRGDPAQVVQRTQQFLDTVTQAAGHWGRRIQRDLESADLRHGNGYAIKLRGVGTVSSSGATK